ncbi:MAG TPA: alpha/beta hydrolase [Caulobacteraceae bacterium]|jgi:pimeloyl-ACP methyl ester carboxylesterase|nr:alpha/beta hydrolase [Caulobacteraceae bacterium]
MTIARMLAALAFAASIAAGPAVAQDAKAPDPRAVIAAVQALPPEGIDELKAIDIGGVKQWISVRGANRKNPILLYIHGGPGSPMMPESWTFQRPWEDYFTVVEWDQRGAGKTFAAAGGKPDASITIDRMQADAEEVIQYLRKTYGQDRIFLVGHSWGSVLGVRVAQHHPEWLYAYIGIGQLIDGRLNEEVGYRETLAEAGRVGNADAVKELKAIAPYPDPDEGKMLQKVVAERKWDVALGGMAYAHSDESFEDGVRAMSPQYNDGDLRAYEKGEMVSVMTLLPELVGVDFRHTTRFECPVFIFAGAHDRTTPESLVETWFATVQAPKKRLFKLDQSAHMVVNEQPGEVLVDLATEVRPLAH